MYERELVKRAYAEFFRATGSEEQALQSTGHVLNLYQGDVSRFLADTRHVTEEHFKRIKNDGNGNPRYVISWCSMGFQTYDEALAACRKIGGRKFHNRQFGGGIAFVSFNLRKTANEINEIEAAIR